MTKPIIVGAREANGSVSIFLSGATSVECAIKRVQDHYTEIDPNNPASAVLALIPGGKQ